MEMDQNLETSISVMMSSVNEYVTVRDGVQKKNLAEQVDAVSEAVSALAKKLSAKSVPRTVLAASMLSDLARKLTEMTESLERLNPSRPLYKSLDVPHLTGKVVRGISELVGCVTRSCVTDMARLEDDMRSLRQVQEQNVRILLTYLIQDGKNLTEVHALLSFAENCRHLGEDVLSMINYLSSFESTFNGCAS